MQLQLYLCPHYTIILIYAANHIMTSHLFCSVSYGPLSVGGCSTGSSVCHLRQSLLELSAQPD